MIECDRMMTTGQYCVSRNWKDLYTAKVPHALTSYFLPLSLSQSSSIFTIISNSLHTSTSTDLNRRHPANEEEHKENKSQAEQLRTLVEGEDMTKQVGGDEAGQEKVEVVERKEDVVGEVKGWAKQEEVQLVKRCGETEEEEEEEKEERRLEKVRKEEEMEVKKLDEMIAMREKERERLEEEEMRKRKAKEEAETETEKKEAESKVDEENNSVPVTPIRKVLSRTSSFEVREEVFIVPPHFQVIRSKTIILEETNERLERTTMNITQTKVKPPSKDISS